MTPEERPATRTQKFLLNELAIRGRVPAPKGRYTRSLRILEERGLVRYSMALDRWSITKQGIEWTRHE